MTDSPADIDPPFRDAALPIADRVENLLGQMTLEEKAGLFFDTNAPSKSQAGRAHYSSLRHPLGWASL